MSLYKDLKNGFYLCSVCATQVKAKTWTAHANGRKHRETVQKLKEAIAKQSAGNAAVKRKMEEDDSVQSKRLKDDESSSEDEQEERQSNIRTQKPWQAEVAQKSADAAKASAASSAKLIDGLPAGFFDNQEMNSKVTATVEKQKNIDTEVDKFFKEIAEEENQKEVEDDAEIEVSAVQKELDEIDEQIERWKAMNELEKKKEEIVEQARFQQQPNFDPVEVDDSTSGDEDFDFNEIDWRTKVL
ncbi:hypothetical protein DdX_13492 [Ditylenchus destructor]|uniref:U1-type domain-containing protein n=1 Tax=Ditylenchus destructor TaxID=166010 RepID=A0AAD4MTL1_9BILA|nr:hypothetical protein DdX_13492 [Ditylenchus destructor]